MRVKVCMKCKEYVPIHPGNAFSNLLQEDFLALHYKHPVQTLSLNEVPKDFKLILLVKIGGGFNKI